MADVYIKSKQPGVIVSHVNPSFKIRFEGKAVKVSKEVAEFLLKDKPNLIVEATEKEAKDASKEEDGNKIYSYDELKAKNKPWQAWKIKELAGEGEKVPSKEDDRIKKIMDLQAKQGGD